MDLKFEFLSLVAVALLAVSFVPTSSGCTSRGDQRLTSAQKYQHFKSQRYLFVQNKQVSNQFNQSQTNNRIRLISGTKEGSSYCPWTWTLDEDVDRIPRYLAKAECPNCNHYCRAVFYTHPALVQRCDRTTGEIIFKMTEKTLGVAYLYEP